MVQQRGRLGCHALLCDLASSMSALGFCLACAGPQTVARLLHLSLLQKPGRGSGTMVEHLLRLPGLKGMGPDAVASTIRLVITRGPVKSVPVLLQLPGSQQFSSQLVCELLQQAFQVFNPNGGGWDDLGFSR